MDFQIRPEINSKFEEKKNVYCEKKYVLCFGEILTIWIIQLRKMIQFWIKSAEI